MSAWHRLTIEQALGLMRTGKLSAAKLAEDCLKRIEKLNPALNAFITVSDRQPVPGVQSASTTLPVFASALHGIPIAVKDLFDTAGMRTTAGSKFLTNNIPEADAFVVEKLKQAGAFIIGKTNTHEIALGVTGDNPHFGTARNPWDTTRIPGGSSSGSAIAVATGMAFAALGTDTGGSIRIPASLCGVVGFKPTYGRVSLRGVLPLSWNLDHAGPITSCVQDAALMLLAVLTPLLGAGASTVFALALLAFHAAIRLEIEQRLDAIAILRCLGARQRTVFAAYLIQAAALAFIGAAVGVVLGFAVQAFLPRVLSAVVPFAVPFAVDWISVGAGLGIGLLVAVLFAVVPLLSIRGVSPLQALRYPPPVV